MQSIHEMYEELYKVIREMPLPSSPDDPEPQEPEEYVEPEWVAQMDQKMDRCGRFEIAYEKAHEWDTLYPDYSPAPEAGYEDSDQPDPEEMDQADWLAPEFGSPKREWYKALNAQLWFIHKCGGSLEVFDDLRDCEF